ncbi:acetate--CoA ligase family protein [Pseudooceanicola sp.]|uniref:acetate--CoA ligase family protein n=1 Tax=Pseudooceanicola sp. TaxID=1914328 RepID=UPI0035C69672
MTRTEPYSRAELLPLYDPKSIAVIGASTRPGSFGGRTVENLVGYDGALYPVNEKYDEIAGVRCYPSLAALPEVPDLAVLTTPAASVEGLLEDCIAAGVPAVMVYASGFSEIGTEEARATQTRIAARAAEAGVRLLGPNCVGMLNYTSGARVSFAGCPQGRQAGGPAIGVVCQSGALGFALAQAMDRGVGISHVASCGNSSDVDVADWVAALADEPTCTAIACAFEGLADPQKFLRAAQIAWDRNKPLVVYKMAVGEEGAAAAMSHTASLAGSAELWEALFDKGGAIAVHDFDALVETAWFFAKAPAPKADGAAMLSGSGGAAIMSSDFAEIADVPMPQPQPEVLARLKDLLPSFVPARNPCDVTAGVINDPDTLMACADALLGDPAYGALVFGYTYAYPIATARQPRLSALAAKHGKPIVYVWMTQLMEGEGRREVEQDPNVVVFSSMRRAFTVMKAWTEREARRNRPASPVLSSTAEARERASALIATASGRALGESASKAILSAYGIAIPAERLVTDRAMAAEVAQEMRVDLAMKVDSPDILHKSDVGGVALNIRGSAAAAAAFDDIMTACRRAHPEARIDGALVQEMIPRGLEVIAGFRNAEGFGPVLTVGMGGLLTELLSDTVTTLAPVTGDEALDMLRGLRGAALFDGYRGAAPADLPAVAEAIAALSRLATDFPDRLAEFDINPLICLPDRCVAVDGLAILSGG